MKRPAVLAGICAGLIFAALPAQEAKPPEANRAEAARFFDEYGVKLKEVARYGNWRGSEWDALKPLLDAACALDPENPCYRREAIMLELSRVHSRIDWRGRLDVFNHFIEQAEAFYKKYPDYRQPFFSHSFPVDSFDNLPVSGATEAERAELSALFDRIRALRDREEREVDFYRGKLDLSDGIGSARELYVYREWIRCGNYYPWYYDTEKMVRETYRKELEFYRAMRDFLRKHPEERAKTLELSNSFLFFMGVDRDEFRRGETIAGMKKIFSNFDEMTALVREIDYRPLTALYESWRAFGEFLNSDRSDAALKQSMFRYYERIEALSPGQALHSFELGFALGYLTRTPSMYPRLQRLQGEYRAEKAGKDTFAQFRNDLCQGNGAGDAERIGRFVPELRKSALAAICDNALHNAFSCIGMQLREIGPSPGKRKLLDELNAAFAIRELPFANSACLNAVEMEGAIYLLFCDGNRRLHVEGFNPGDLSLAPLPDPGLEASKFQPRLYGQGGGVSFSASGGRLILGGRDAVALYDLKTREWTLVEDLPGNDVVSSAIVGDRCYCLLGGRAAMGVSEELLSLCSFRLDGTDRRLHFSARRADKETPLDSLPKGRVTGLIVLPGGKLVFGTVFFGQTATLWSFDPKTESFEKFQTFENTCDMALRDQGGFVLGNCYSFGERFFSFDKESGRITCFLTQSKDDAKWAKESNVRQLKGMWELKEPFLLADGFLLSAAGSDCPLVLDLKNPEESPLLLVPSGVNVFRLPDGSWVFIGPKQLSVVKLK